MDATTNSGYEDKVLIALYSGCLAYLTETQGCIVVQVGRTAIPNARRPSVIFVTPIGFGRANIVASMDVDPERRLSHKLVSRIAQ